jgi:hypothetical protein
VLIDLDGKRVWVVCLYRYFRVAPRVWGASVGNASTLSGPKVQFPTRDLSSSGKHHVGLVYLQVLLSTTTVALTLFSLLHNDRMGWIAVVAGSLATTAITFLLRLRAVSENRCDEPTWFLLLEDGG